jgi:hypothetical protein
VQMKVEGNVEENDYQEVWLKFTDRNQKESD